jgi:dTDP-4-amino-4,6-dideoxygalactose transaminase
MSNQKLAFHNGEKVRTRPFGIRKTIGEAEIKAVNDVLHQGDISLFFGSPGDFFLGGPQVKAFEEKWAEKYGFKHAISVNSWTTGLMAAVGAVGISPGDEVLCAPFSMSATATSILFYGGIPVFVDIEEDTFNIDPKKLEEKITPRTKAIMLVHLFGHPAEMDAINAIAKKHNLKVIEDAAHAPGAKYKGQYVGAIGDLGGFSFNYHKHIHSGEGGLIVTNNEELAKKCQLIRNHGENCFESIGISDKTNVIGANYRLTEIQAAIANIQTDLVEGYVNHRNKLAEILSKGLSKHECFIPAQIKPDCIHSFYIYPFRYNPKIHGVSRSTLTKAILAELPTPKIWEQTALVEGYGRPLYLNPIYQEKRAFGRGHFPWDQNPEVEYNYTRGICPVVERMHFEELMLTPLIREAVDENDIHDLLKAIDKVIANIHELRGS